MTEITKLKDSSAQIAFKERLQDVMLFPSMIRLTHIYTRVNAIFALKRAFQNGMQLYYTADGIDEMKLALCYCDNGDPDLLFVTILTHLIDNLSKNAKHL